MKRLITLLFLLSVYASAAAAQDLDKGRKALENGDDAVAFEQLLPLAEQGNAEAQAYVGVIYHNGKAVPKDDIAAARWVKAAAEQGLGDAQFLLGYYYSEGRGVPQDDVLAYMWFNLATGAQNWPGSFSKEDIEATVRRSGLYRNDIVREMSRAEIKEAQRRTRDWLDAHPQ